jgi:hypothetical protein
LTFNKRGRKLVHNKQLLFVNGGYFMSKAVKWLLGLVVIALAAVAAFFAFGRNGGKQADQDDAKVGKLNVAYNNPESQLRVAI